MHHPGRTLSVTHNIYDLNIEYMLGLAHGMEYASGLVTLGQRGQVDRLYHALRMNEVVEPGPDYSLR